jgi:hypothetical protein
MRLSLGKGVMPDDPAGKPSIYEWFIVYPTGCETRETLAEAFDFVEGLLKEGQCL